MRVAEKIYWKELRRWSVLSQGARRELADTAGQEIPARLPTFSL
jgi:hypothetical protein